MRLAAQPVNQERIATQNKPVFLEKLFMILYIIVIANAARKELLSRLFTHNIQT
jgi:hypothetical protein